MAHTVPLSHIGDEDRAMLLALLGREDLVDTLSAFISGIAREITMRDDVTRERRRRRYVRALRQIEAGVSEMLALDREDAEYRAMNDAIVEAIDPAVVHSQWREQLTSIIRGLQSVTHSKEKKERGRPADPLRAFLEIGTAMLLIQAGVRVSKHVNGTFAKVLPVVYRCAGIEVPVDLFPYVKRGVDGAHRLESLPEGSHVPMRLLMMRAERMAKRKQSAEPTVRNHRRRSI